MNSEPDGQSGDHSGVGKGSNYRASFRKPHAILPVIHVETETQSLRNANIAREAGCDGVFLINHSSSFRTLLAIQHVVSREFPDWWIGVNCLDLAPGDVFHHLTHEVAGVWVDNAMIDENQGDQREAAEIQALRAKSGWEGIYFGGVAFKYQRPVQDCAHAAKLATPYMDVVTTSGPGTGMAAPVSKIAAMKMAIDSFPLAIASGITPGNVADYLDVTDCFLVATGIGKSFTEFDPSLVNALVNTVRSHTSPTFPDHSKSTMAWRARPIRSICFVCEWNEGRSVHLELSTRRILRTRGNYMRVTSAGLSQGAGINALRRTFLARKGVPEEEIRAHGSRVFGLKQLDTDLVLVAELPMKTRLLADWPGLSGRVMTVRGFLRGITPEEEDSLLSARQTYIEDAAGHSENEKLVLYDELEQLAEELASRLSEIGAFVPENPSRTDWRAS